MDQIDEIERCFYLSSKSRLVLCCCRWSRCSLETLTIFQGCFTCGRWMDVSNLARKNPCKYSFQSHIIFLWLMTCLLKLADENCFILMKKKPFISVWFSSSYCAIERENHWCWMVTNSSRCILHCQTKRKYRHMGYRRSNTCTIHITINIQFCCYLSEYQKYFM